MTKPAVIYARVSSDRQKEDHTIASQTAALIEYAEREGFAVPKEWIFQDEGYSGASIVRPGLEAVRDLAAEGHIEAVLIHSPDRLSRKYAYQVLLAEEFSKHGVELRFVKSPSVTTPEDQLLVQFQGMIAEYERAQILERSRRGKRHRAQQGSISVLSGAPFGYRYMKKSDSTAAYYEVLEAEADVVRLVFQTYIEQAASINAITRMLNERQIPTRKGIARWERSTVWAMLRNPAYVGRACFGKTELRQRQRITRPLRQRMGHATRNSANHERPRQDWIEIPVPALVSESTFALAQEQLERNKHHSPRRTIEPSLLQGMLVCEKCGYALYRSSAQTSKHKLYYYRCLGSDAYRYRNGAVCDNRPIRQDYLDSFVWAEILRLLDDPTLIQAELDRRMEMAKKADPLRKREESLQREQVRIQKNIDRLVTAYQEELVTLEQLRHRMPELRRQEKASRSELLSLAEATADQSRYLRLVETLAQFRERLRARADSLEIAPRQKILRLLVKEILVGTETVTIRHSIPAPHSGPGPDRSSGPDHLLSSARSSAGYLLRSRSHDTPDFYGLVTALCVAPLNAPVRPDAPAPRMNPNRASTYLEPKKAFDDLYWMGTPSRSTWALTTSDGIILYDTQSVYDAEDVIVGGLKKLGLDPAKVKYVIISHAHGNEVGGAKLMQERYGAHIVMGAGDWDMVDQSVNGFPNGKPKRDIVATDGMKITLGGRTITIYLVPGHTPGTISGIFQVHDHGKPLTVAYSGGTEFNFVNDMPHFDTYLASERKFAAMAAAAGATIILGNQSQFDSAALKLRTLADRRPGEAHPLDVGPAAVARYFRIEDECAQAVRLKLLAAQPGQ